MEEYQKRVVVEREQLVGRLTNLNEYLGKLPPGPHTISITLLYKQARAMSAYLAALDERIVGFPE